MISAKKIKQAAVVLKVIAHPERLKIIESLNRQKEMTVSELMDAVGVSQVTLSKHLALLRAREIVQSKVNGNYRHYSIKNRNVVSVLNCMRNHED